MHKEGYPAPLAEQRGKRSARRMRPERMKPLSEEGEKVVLDLLVEKLRQHFGVRVSGNLDHSREGGEVKPVYKMLC